MVEEVDLGIQDPDVLQQEQIQERRQQLIEERRRKIRRQRQQRRQKRKEQRRETIISQLRQSGSGFADQIAQKIEQGASFQIQDGEVTGQAVEQARQDFVEAGVTPGGVELSEEQQERLQQGGISLGEEFEEVEAEQRGELQELQERAETARANEDIVLSEEGELVKLAEPGRFPEDRVDQDVDGADQGFMQGFQGDTDIPGIQDRFTDRFTEQFAPDLSREQEIGARRAGLSEFEAEAAVLEARERGQRPPETAGEFGTLGALQDLERRQRGGLTRDERLAQIQSTRQAREAEQIEPGARALEQFEQQQSELQELETEIRSGEAVLTGEQGERLSQFESLQQVEEAQRSLSERRERTEDFIGERREDIRIAEQLQSRLRERDTLDGVTAERQFQQLSTGEQATVLGSAFFSPQSRETVLSIAAESPISSIAPPGLSQALEGSLGQIADLGEILDLPTQTEVGGERLETVAEREQGGRTGPEFFGDVAIDASQSLPAQFAFGLAGGAVLGRATQGLRGLGATTQAALLERGAQGAGLLATGAAGVEVGEDVLEGDVSGALETGLSFAAVGAGFGLGVQQAAPPLAARTGRPSGRVTRGVAEGLLARRGGGEVGRRGLRFTFEAPESVAARVGRGKPTNLVRIGAEGQQLVTPRSQDLVQAEFPFTQAAPTETSISAGPVFRGQAQQRFIVEQPGDTGLLFRGTGRTRLVDVRTGQLEATAGGGFGTGTARVSTVQPITETTTAAGRNLFSERFLTESLRPFRRGEAVTEFGVRGGSIAEGVQTGRRVSVTERFLPETTDLPVTDRSILARNFLETDLAGRVGGSFTVERFLPDAVRTFSSSRVFGEGGIRTGITATERATAIQTPRGTRVTGEAFETGIRGGGRGRQEFDITLLDEPATVTRGAEIPSFTGQQGQITLQRQRFGGAVTEEAALRITPQVVSNIQGISVANLPSTQAATQGGGLVAVPSFIGASLEQDQADTDVEPAPFTPVEQDGTGRQVLDGRGEVDRTVVERFVLSPERVGVSRRTTPGVASRFGLGTGVDTGRDVELDVGVDTEVDTGLERGLEQRPGVTARERSGLRTGVGQGLDTGLETGFTERERQRQRRGQRTRTQLTPSGVNPVQTTTAPPAGVFGLPLDSEEAVAPGTGERDIGPRGPVSEVVPRADLISASVSELTVGQATTPVGREAQEEFGQPVGLVAGFQTVEERGSFEQDGEPLVDLPDPGDFNVEL